MTTKQPIKLEDCEVKQARRGTKMEVMLKGSTKIADSPKKFNIPSADFEDDPLPPPVNQCVRQNYVKVTECINVGDKHKQDVTVADTTATATVTLWEETSKTEPA